jgi:hypothetical protein
MEGQMEGAPKAELAHANGHLPTLAYSFPSPPSAPPSAQPARESPNKMALPSPAGAVPSADPSAVASAKSPLESFLEHYKLDRMVLCLGPGQQEALMRQPTFGQSALPDGQRDGAADSAANGATKTDEWLGGQSDWLGHKRMATLPSTLSKTAAARNQSPTNPTNPTNPTSSHRLRSGSVNPVSPIRAASLILQRESTMQRESTALRGSDLYGTVRQRLRRVESFPAPPKTSSE